MTRNIKNIEGKGYNEEFAFSGEANNVPRRMQSISDMRGSTIMSTAGGSKLAQEAIPEF